jgi:RNA polymerase sigma-70 factor (TIGR02960 family)
MIAPDSEFSSRTAHLRPELLAHCYRMLGSLHDAEDQVQETYVRAWRGYGRFEGRTSIRRWMYTIATRTCLSAAAGRARRPLPSGLGPPAEDHRVHVADAEPSIPWLQPVPDTLVRQDDPADIVADRASLRLALIAALQVLSPRQRAVLILRDILVFSGAETADMLDASVDAVDALLRRARVNLARAGLDARAVGEPQSPAEQRILDRYLRAFVAADPTTMAAVVRADIELEMPPTPTWFTGRDAVIGFLAHRVWRHDRWHAVPDRSNGQPALLFYQRRGDGHLHAYGVQVLTLRDGLISRITAFNDPALVAAFGAPPLVTDAVYHPPP